MYILIYLSYDLMLILNYNNNNLFYCFLFQASKYCAEFTQILEKTLNKSIKLSFPIP